MVFSDYVPSPRFSVKPGLRRKPGSLKVYLTGRHHAPYLYQAQRMRRKVLMMADVACFCGCLYSFDGGGGACPKCGEYVSLTTGPELKVTEYTEYAADLHFLAQLVDPALVDRKTALCAGDEAPQGLRRLGVALGVHDQRAG
jgi:hypothetical protein